MTPAVFISYASEDKAVADIVCATLEGAGAPCWIAPRSIPPGSNYPTEIVKALRQCRLLVLVFSRYSNASTHVAAELEIAMSQEITRIPLRIEDLAPSGGNIYTLAGCQWFDALPVPSLAHLQELARRVSERLAEPWTPFVPVAETVARPEGIAELPALLPGPPPATEPTPEVTLQTSLPADLSSLIGRDRETAEVAQLLDDPAARLVTLTGPGGVGKTRLAIRAAGRWAEATGYPACLVEMEGLHDSCAVAPAIMGALGIPQSPGREPLRLLGDILARQPLLLVCDNAEQITDLGLPLQHLLRQAPGLKCLLTSRATLKIPGEMTYRLAPLASPEPQASLEALRACPSVALFRDRARAVAPGWEVTEANADAVGEICRRLEGMPLCLELAASRMTMVSAQEALEGLDDVLAFLASRSPNLPPRQRTLRGAMEWSRRLLDPEQQAAFAQLSVLRGGFFKEAAAAVTRSPHLLDLLQDLQSHSILSASPVEGRTRFAMLETVRAYAQETLTPPVGEPEDICRRHAEHFRQVAADLAQAVRSPGESAALAALALERENLRAALVWADRADSALCARIAEPLADLLTRRGLWADALQAAESGLQAARKTADPALLAGALVSWASAVHDRGNLEPAREAAEEGLALWRQLDREDRVAPALNLLGLVAQDGADPARARGLFEESLALYQRLGHPVGQAVALNNLGRLALAEERLSEARPPLDEALAIRREIGDRRGYAEALGNLGVLAQEAGDLQTARAHYRECLGVLRDLGDDSAGAMQLCNLGEAAALAGDYDAAVPLVAGAARIFRHLGSPNAQYAELLLLVMSERPQAQPFAERLRMANEMHAEEIARLALQGPPDPAADHGRC